MKTASLPSIRVEPEFREALEGALTGSETISSFIDEAVRAEVRRRKLDAEFHARGLASLARVRAGEPTVSSDAVLAKLEGTLAAADAQIARKRKAAA